MDERHLAATAAPDLVPVGLTIDQHLAAIGPEQTTENLDERGFAGAVLTQESQNFATMDVEAHALQGAGRPEALADVVETGEVPGSPSFLPPRECRTAAANPRLGSVPR